MPESRQRIGLIAGAGRLPVIVAQGMRARGFSVCAVGFGGQYEPELPGLCDRFKRVSPLRIGQWARALRRFGAHEAVMVGGVSKAKLVHDPLRYFRQLPDWRTVRAWFVRAKRDKRSPVLMRAIAEELRSAGVMLIDSTTHIPEHLASPGAMTRRAPSAREQADIDFVWPLLTDALRLGIGQSMTVREGDVIAVEAIEGTDRMIARTGELCRKKGWTLVKAAGAAHDHRADVPTVGVSTVRNVHAAGGRCIALAAGEVILVDKPEVLALADELGVAISGVRTA